MSKKNTTATEAISVDAQTIIVPRALLRDIYKVLDGVTAITETSMGKRLAYIREAVTPIKNRVFELVIQ